MATFGWLTKTAAVAALQARLNSSVFWTASECWIYVTEALRHWGSLTEQWPSDFVLSNANGAWFNTGTLALSPRLRTVTDQYLYNQMCSMLLEPQLSSGAWAGTKQFTLQNLQYSLQKRCQEVIQATACNLGLLPPIPATPGTRRTQLSDTVLEPWRIRFLSTVASTTGTASVGATAVTVASAQGIAQGLLVTGTGIQAGTFVISVVGTTAKISLPTTASFVGTALQFSFPVYLSRSDTRAFQAFEPDYLQASGIPQNWSIASEPPLAFDVDYAPNTPGNYEVIALNAAATFDPPNTSLLGIPDDWSWVPMYGALADVLGIESEATDRERSAYCLQRYMEGVQMMKQSNWLLQAQVNGVATSTPSLREMDTAATGWQESQGWLPSVVQAGMDMLAPTPGNGQSLLLTLVGNAPLLDPTGTYVQVSRDDWASVLDYAHHIAAFKMGGQEFAATVPMLKGFYEAAAQYNKRWVHYGNFVELLRTEGEREEAVSPR